MKATSAIVAAAAAGELTPSEAVADAQHGQAALFLSVYDTPESVADHQKDRPAERNIVSRIGINLGDVVVDGGDLMGDGAAA